MFTSSCLETKCLIPTERIRGWQQWGIECDIWRLGATAATAYSLSTTSLNLMNLVVRPPCPIHGMWGGRMTSFAAVPTKNKHFFQSYKHLKKVITFFWPYMTKVLNLVFSNILVTTISLNPRFQRVKLLALLPIL